MKGKIHVTINKYYVITKLCGLSPKYMLPIMSSPRNSIILTLMGTWVGGQHKITSGNIPTSTHFSPITYYLSNILVLQTISLRDFSWRWHNENNINYVQYM